MSHYLNPIDVAEQPRRDLIRYLLTSYPLRDPHLRHALKRELSQPGTIWQQPYLEGSQPYVATRSVADLVQDAKVKLHPETVRLFTPSDRKLYEHQVNAVEAVVAKGQNIIVATGTGSGKTECFLIPMVDQLLKEGDKLRNAGVRVLILYPMNALVNDQVKRLRQLLCAQADKQLRFGFYTSRTPRETEGARGALEALKKEFQSYSTKNLLKLFNSDEIAKMDFNDRESLIEAAIQKTRQVQMLSRKDIWEAPPHILVTNYSMLEHMLIRPNEREKIFEASKDTFSMLVVDEAHSYNGATGTEVAMLISRFKAAVGVESRGRIRCIATSASLGSQDVDDQVMAFADQLFGEPFSQVVRGRRTSSDDRLGAQYNQPEALAELPPYEPWSLVSLPDRGAPIAEWAAQLELVVPQERLAAAEPLAAAGQTPEERVSLFLWHALKGHPLVHQVIDLLARAPRPWEQLAQSSDLWGVALPRTLEGEIEPEVARMCQVALANLVQIGTLARLHAEDMPLVPVRVHLLFRSIEGVYACLNAQCPGACHDPARLAEHRPRYGKLYLAEKEICEACQGPVIELASCRKCGQAYGLTDLAGSEGMLGKLSPVPRYGRPAERLTPYWHLTAGPLDSVTDDENPDSAEEEARVGTFHLHRQANEWKGMVQKGSLPPAEHIVSPDHYALTCHLPPESKEPGDGLLSSCPACGAGRAVVPPIRPFVTTTDAPLEVLLDSLFELLPDPQPHWRPQQATKRRMLAFSDGRQDAAFFASDFQRTHTEALYRQLVWHAFQDVAQDGRATVRALEDKLVEKFLAISIPHPDRLAEDHHKSYVEVDPFDGDGAKRKNRLDCETSSRKRAKELLLREFGLPSARRFSLEAKGLLACHVPFDGRVLELVGERLGITPEEAGVYLTALTDIIRLSGVVDLKGSSNYFPETGGDGRRPAMLDGAGRSRKYLRFKRDVNEKDAYGFCWRADRQGQPTKAQNHFVSFTRDFLGQLPDEATLNGLFSLLVDQGYLNPNTATGYQLNWGLLTVTRDRADWFRCNTCQQKFHRPGLEALWETGLPGARRCAAYRCEGELMPLHLDLQADTGELEDHYEHLVTARDVFPLRAQEHTAQLGVNELEKRENRFIDGFINLLSCSTTLEMGVDIGELQAVALRNFPPHVSNYQQRAGRAGRRADGVAVTLMYGQRRPHDRYYFERPELLIAGENRVPVLMTSNVQIQERHIRAELLAAFLRPFDHGAEDVSMAGFYALPDPDTSEAFQDFSPPTEALAVKLREWLAGDQARQLADAWVARLGQQTTGSGLLERFTNALATFDEQQLRDWNGLVEMLRQVREVIMENPGVDWATNKLKALRGELKKVRARKLHGELAQACVLPIYGFPIDVVRLLTGESDERATHQGKHRLERDRRLALGEYAPGQEIVVDDRVHKSVGVVRPNALERHHYVVCRHCNYFHQTNADDTPAACPVCGSGDFANDRRTFKVPTAFTTHWGEPPQVTPYNKPRRQPVSQVFLANNGANAETYDQRPDCYVLTVTHIGTFFLANKGPRTKASLGFPLCYKCGRDLSDKVKAAPRKRAKRGEAPMESAAEKSNRLQHTHPITGAPCESSYEYLHLGHKFHSDLVKIRFALTTRPTALFSKVTHYDDGTIASVEEEKPEKTEGQTFWYSLTYALLAAASQVIDVPRAEIDGLFVPAEGTDGLADIVLYDNVPGGAGYAKRIAEQFDEVIARAYTLVTSCDCERSCYDCLRTYGNQIFHEKLDKREVERFLAQLVDQVQPDPALLAFAPNAARVPLGRMARRLRALSRQASPASIMVLPDLEDAYNLDGGAPMPWFKLVTEAVYAMERHKEPLQLVLRKLPDRGTLEGRFMRKRLWQWIDQGLVQLHETTVEVLPSMVFSSAQTHPTAMALHASEADGSLEWFETHSAAGVQVVLDRLGGPMMKAHQVAASTLEDPDTVITWPSRSWKGLTLDELRDRLGLGRVFDGAPIKQVRYSDRYFYKVSAIELFTDLVLGAPLAPDVDVHVQAQERRDSPPAADIAKNLREGLKGFEAAGVTPRIRVQASTERREFPHKRQLEIVKQDGTRVVVLFDKGLDFIDRREVGGECRYDVWDDTYLIITGGAGAVSPA